MYSIASDKNASSKDFLSYFGSCAELLEVPRASKSSSSALCKRLFYNTSQDEATAIAAPTFDSNSRNVVVAYAVLFVVAAVGNSTVFVKLYRSRRRKSRINMMLSHLAIADMIVAFIMIPIEVGWRVTVRWLAGNLACKVLLFLRAFGLYLSSNVLICISLDRYYAVLHPLKVTDAHKRGKLMLAFAWGMSVVCSIPQTIVFHVSPHPTEPDFEQCVSFGFFSSVDQEIAYNIFCISAIYFVPLLVISFAYIRIFIEISNKSKENKDDLSVAKAPPVGHSARLRLRRSDIRNIKRARSRTLRMTITIISVFAWCWLPYTVMTLWFMFDRQGAMKLDVGVQDMFFLMAVSNSCMNPLVYGGYAIKYRKECGRVFRCFFQRSSPNCRGISTVCSVNTKSTPMCITGRHKAILGKFNFGQEHEKDKRDTRNFPGIKPIPKSHDFAPRTAADLSSTVNSESSSMNMNWQKSIHSDPTPCVSVCAHRGTSNRSFTRSLEIDMQMTNYRHFMSM